MTTKKKLLVTGACGFVAGSVLAQAGDDWHVHAASRGQPLAQREDFHWHTCEQTPQWVKIFDEIRPDVVIHTAALADIDFCEVNQELARAVNVELTRTLANLCAEVSAKLVFCSTDTIFNGEQAPYVESDSPAPVNFYAETKVEAERIVASLGTRSVIARLSLIVGLPVLGAGNSFLARMIATFREGRTVALSEQEIRTPVDVITVGKTLLELAAGDHQGIYHVAGNERLNRFEIARKIAVRFGFPKEMVVAQAVATAQGRAVRPLDVSLDNTKARANLKTPMLNLDEGLSLILQTAATPTP